MHGIGNASTAVCGMKSWANSVPSVYHSHSLQLRLATANVHLLHARAFHYLTVNSKYVVCIKLFNTQQGSYIGFHLLVE